MSRGRMPGLTKRGDVWHIEKQIKGYGRLRESCGTTNLKEAERYLTHRLEEIRLAEVYGVRPTRTFEQAAVKYLEDYQYKRSIERDVIALRIVMPYIGQLPLDYGTSSGLRGKGTRSPVTRRMRLSSKAIEVAVSKKLAGATPVSRARSRNRAVVIRR